MFERTFCAFVILTRTRFASSYSFSGPGGSGARQRGHVSDTPFDRSSPTHPVQNEWPHGSCVGSRGGARQTRHLSVSTAALHSRSCCAWKVAART